MSSTSPTELLFCDVCNESVPLKDLDDGRAVRRKGRVVCSSCEGAMSHGRDDDEPVADAPRSPSGPPEPKRSAAREPRAVPAAAGRGGPGSGAGLAAFGAFLGLAGIAAAVGGGFWLKDGLDAERVARLEAQENLRGRIEASGQRVEAALRADSGTLQEEVGLLRAELGSLRERIEEAAQEERERTDGLRAELGSNGQRLTALEALGGRLDDLSLEIGKVGRFTADLHAQQLRITERLEALREDVGDVRDLASVDVGALLGAGPDAAPDAGVDRAPWLDFVGDLKSQSESVRWQAVQSIGQAGDPAAAEYLTPMLNDPDIFVRMAAARNLGDLGAPLGIPALIDALEDPEESVRESAAVSLRAMTEKDFRFEPGDKEADRAKAVKRWREWWDGAKDDLLGA